MPKPTLKRKSSNEVVEEIWQCNQDFLACQNRAPTPELLPNFNDDLEDALEWGSDCYVTAGTFARRGLSSTAKTLRSLVRVRGCEC